MNLKPTNQEILSVSKFIKGSCVVLNFILKSKHMSQVAWVVGAKNRSTFDQVDLYRR